MNTKTQPRSLKRILIETVVFSFLLALLLMYNLKEDDNVAEKQSNNTELSIHEAKSVSVF